MAGQEPQEKEGGRCPAMGRPGLRGEQGEPFRVGERTPDTWGPAISTSRGQVRSTAGLSSEHVWRRMQQQGCGQALGQHGPLGPSALVTQAIEDKEGKEGQEGRPRRPQSVEGDG